MSVERVYVCDWHECGAQVQTAASLPPGFLSVTEGADHQRHFCDWDCLLKYAAEKPPPQLIPLGPASDA